MMRLTERAQAAVAECLRRGETAVDATAGNGHDTRFLAETVGPLGRVYAFDVQPAALQSTARQLERGRLHNVVLCGRDHAEMMSVIPAAEQGRVGAVMFNLGYLPGGDKRLTTSAASTVQGVAAALQLLRPGGVLTVLAYPGHPGGAAEVGAVTGFLQSVDPSEFQVETVRAESSSPAAPLLFILRRQPDSPGCEPAFGQVQ